MLRFLFDTDHLTLFENGHPVINQRYQSEPKDAVGVSAVTVQESLRGRLASLARHPAGPLCIQAYANLLSTVKLFSQFPLVEFDRLSETQFVQLRATLRHQVGAQDLRIASVALVRQLTLLTRNRRDFSRVPGIKLDDWSV